MFRGILALALCLCACFKAAEAARGDLVSATKVQTRTAADMGKLLRDVIPTEAISDLEKNILSDAFGSAEGKELFGIEQYTIVFKSLDPNGQEYDAKATALIPAGASLNSWDTIVYNHMDVVDYDFRPTSTKFEALFCNINSYYKKQCRLCCNEETSAVMKMSMWTALGFGVIAPETPGMSKQFTSAGPPSNSIDSYTMVTIDALSAYKTFTDKSMTSRVILTGYGTGALATMSVQIELEKSTTVQGKGINIIASFPQAGPFYFEKYARGMLKDLATEGTANPYHNNLVAFRFLLAKLSWQNNINFNDVFFTHDAQYTLAENAFRTLDACLQKISFVNLNPEKNCSEFEHAIADAEGLIKPTYAAIFKSKISDFGIEEKEPYPSKLETALFGDSKKLLERVSKWNTKATIYLCSARSQGKSANTEAISATFNHSRHMYDTLTKNGINVVKDEFASDETFHCSLALLSVLDQTDWVEAEQEFLHGKKVDPEENVEFSLPLGGILLLCFFGVFSLVYGTCYSYEKITKKKCPTACDVWIFVLTKCAIVILLLGLGVAAGMLVIGMMASGWSINIDSDFAGYMTADSALKLENDMFDNAKIEQKATIPSKKSTSSASRRRLAGATRQSRTWTTLDLFYEAKSPDSDRGIFYKEALAEIKDFEGRFQALKDYKSFCLMRIKNPGIECDLPASIVNIVWGTVEFRGGRIQAYNNGSALEMQSVKTVLNALQQKEVFWFTDKYFSDSNLTSVYLRSSFKMGLPLKGFENTPGVVNNAQKEKMKVYFASLYDDFLTKENEKLKHVQITWYEPKYLVDYEVNVQLLHDAAFSLFSFAFVFVFVWLHLESMFLAMMAMISIVLAFPMAYCIFYVVVGVEKMMLLNFVSLFLIMGIGADDVFVMYDTYQQATAVLRKSATEQQRWAWTYKEAGGAMLITTVTTCGSFFSNWLSSVKVVREFGIFMGLVVVFNYINVMIIFPSSMVLHEKLCAKIQLKKLCRPKKIAPAHKKSLKDKVKKSLKRTRTRKKKVSDLIDVHELHCCEKFFFHQYSNTVYKCRYFIVIFSVLMAAFSGMAAVSNFATSSGPPVVYQEEHNLGRLDKMQRKTFKATGKSDYERAMTEFSPYEITYTDHCPEYNTRTEVECNGHGTCDKQSYKCKQCDDSYFGDACNLIKSTGKLKNTPSEPVSFELLSTSEEQVYTFELLNAGQRKLHYIYQAQNHPSWLILGPNKEEKIIEGVVEGSDVESGDNATLVGKAMLITVKLIGVNAKIDFAANCEVKLAVYSEEAIADFVTFTLPVSVNYWSPPDLKTNHISFFFKEFRSTGSFQGYKSDQYSSTEVNDLKYDISSLIVNISATNYNFSLHTEGRLMNRSTIALRAGKVTALDIRATRLVGKRVVLTESLSYQFLRRPPTGPKSVTIASFSSVSSGTIALSVICLPDQTDPNPPRLDMYVCHAYSSGTLERIEYSLVGLGQNVTLKGLTPSKYYTVACFCNNSAGQKTALTKQTTPAILANNVPPTIYGTPTINKISSTAVSISNVNYTLGGAKALSITCESSDGKSVTVASNVDKFKLEGLKLDTYNTTFFCRMKDENNQISQKSGTKTISPGAPLIPPIIERVTVSDKSVTVTVRPNASETVNIDSFECMAITSESGAVVASKTGQCSSCSPSTETNIIVGPLTNGVTYELVCQAKNSAGSTDASDPSVVIPYGPPAKITGAPNASVTIEDASSTGRSRMSDVVVTLPTDTGGMSIDQIQCRAKNVNGNSIITKSFDGSYSEGVTVTNTFKDLSLGQNYTISCRVKNTKKLYSLEYSPESNLIQAVGISKPVVNLVVARSGNRSIKATFSPPVNNGGHPIIFYNCCAIHVASGEKQYSNLIQTTSVEFGSLKIGNEYEAECFPLTKLGAGEKQRSNKVIAAMIPPVAPSISVNVNGKGIVTISQSAYQTLEQHNETGGLTISKWSCMAYVNDSDVTIGSWRTSNGKVLLISVTGLPVDTQVSFRCYFETSFGQSPLGERSLPVWAHTVPTAPSFMFVRRNSQGAIVRLNPPQDTGGDDIVAEIKFCNCFLKTDPSKVFRSGESNPYLIIVSSLVDGTVYQFVSTCTNYLGAGPESLDSRKVIPLTPPAPDIPAVAIQGSPGEITVFNSMTGKDLGKLGFVDVFNCTVTSMGDGEIFVKSGNNVSNIVFPNCVDGTNYSVRCQAISSTTQSPWSARQYVTPSTIPGQPQNPPEVTSLRGKIIVTDLDTPSNGGATITSYRCTAEANGASTTVTGVATSSESFPPDGITITGLTNGANYAVSCSAQNSAGSGNASVTFSTPSGIPDAPRNIVWTRNGSRSIYVSFLPPLKDGGKHIRNYTCNVTGTLSGITTSFLTTLQHIFVGGLQNGMKYIVTCICSNDHGPSPLSLTKAITPATIPSFLEVTNIVQTSMRKVEVFFVRPANGGTPITSISCSGNASVGILEQYIKKTNSDSTGSATSIALLYNNDFVPNSKIYVNCFATNDVGSGNGTIVDDLVLAGPPLSPQVNIEALDQVIFVKANGQTLYPAFPITQYECSLNGQSNWKTSTLGNFVFDINDGVKNGQYYDKIKCRASNSALGPSTDSPLSLKVKPGKVMMAMVDITYNGAAITETKVYTELQRATAAGEGVLYITSFDEDFANGKMRVAFHVLVSNGEFDTMEASIKSLTETFQMTSVSDVTLSKNPIVAEDDYFINDIDSIEYKIDDGVYIRLNTFSPHVFEYFIPVPSTSSQISFDAKPVDQKSKIDFNANGKVYIDDVNPVALKEGFAPAQVTTVDIRVTAADGVKRLVYRMNVGRLYINCSQPCNNGTCNLKNGKCECESDYLGEFCDIYCPGVSNNCYGNGVCVNDTNAVAPGCLCHDTYSGSDCLSRACPKCDLLGVKVSSRANGGCDSDFKCDCERGFGGKLCANRTCYNNCYNHGDCIAGVCQCARSFEGEFCDQPISSKVQMKYATEISFVYGILSTMKSNSSKLVYSKNVDFMSQKAQLFLLNTCENIMSQTEYDIDVRKDYPCWISAFRDYVVDEQKMDFPVSRSLYPALLGSFMNWYPTQRTFDESTSYTKDIGTAETDYRGRINWVALTFRCNVDKNSGAQTLLPTQKEWLKVFQQFNAANPKSVGEGRMISDAFTKMDTEIGIIYSTITSFAVSNLICLVCVIVFTGDLVVSVFTMLSIILIVITLMGFLFAVMGYTFGAIEAVGVTIFVGMSVDYALHMAHGYHGAHGDTRFEKIRQALAHLGVSIIGGAATTAGAAIFLFFCHMYLFIQLGTMMFMNTLLALYFSIVFMVALLAIVGPLTHACDIYHVLKVCKTRICLAAWKKLTSKRKTGKRRRIFPDAAPTSKSAQDIEQEAEHHKNIQEKALSNSKESARKKLDERLAARRKKG